MKQLLLCAGVLAGISMSAQEAPKFESQFPLRWKAKIGGTTFKTNFVLHEGMLIVGSNGNHYRDWRLDNDNGVFFINPANGKIINHLAHEQYGDMDVNGIAAQNGNIYFGNDNDEFFCYNTSGKLQWRVPVSGDVEAEPVLLDVTCDGISEVIFATETGEVAALDTRTGDVVWSFKIKDFSGWNKTDNRLLFKVGAHFSNGSGFVAKPAVTELSGDATPDLIYNCRDNYTYAINGENGALLWKFNHGELYYIANAPLVAEEGKQKRIYVLQNRVDEKNNAHTHIVSLNSKGVLQKTYAASWHYSVNYAPVYHNQRLISCYRDTVVAINVQSGVWKKIALPSEKEHYGNFWYSTYGIVSARPQFFDFLKTGSDQLMVVNEEGYIELLDADSFKYIKRFMLPDGTEANPLIADMDGDGRLEMLAACYDGYLYCFDLKTSAKGFIAAVK